MTTPTATTPASPDSLREQVQLLFVDGLYWLQHHWLNTLIAIAVASVIVTLLYAARGFARRRLARDPGASGWGKVFERAVGRTGGFFIVMVAVRVVARYAYPPEAVAATIAFLFTVAAVFQAAIWVREIILGAIEHRTQSEHYSGEALLSALGLIRVLVTFALFAIALVVVLDNLGVNVTGLVAGLGVGGIAIGLAAQGIFADLFAALAIIFDRPFRRGDAISYDQTSGTVEEIGLKSTRIRGVNGEERIIANKQLLEKEIQNNTRREHRRIKFALGLVCQTPADVCARIPGMLREVVEGCDLVFVRAGFVNFGASSLDFELEFDSPHQDFEHGYRARHTVGLAILKRFDAEGIDFAYPTQTSFTAAPDGTLVLPYADHHEPARG